MPKFATATDALDYAMKILYVLRGGRSSMASLDEMGGGQGKNYAILDAIEIESAAQRACRNGWPCPYLRDECLFHYHIPDPLVKYPPMSYAQECRVQACDTRFRETLRKKKYIE